MDELVRFLTACLDEDALWATEASRRYGEAAPEGGVHWQWEDSDTDETVVPDPGRDEVVGGESFRVSLRSRETWPTHSAGELPQFAIPTAEEVPSAVGGHIVRHDPARVLREIDAKRRVLALHSYPTGHGCSTMDKTGYNLNYDEVSPEDACTTLRLLALPYEDREGYQESWRP